jgi:multidrug efflux pump subunit AcrA (membrane-fusion protein)
MTGKVTAVALVGTTTSNVVTYPVTVTLVGVPKTIKLGATVSLSITTGTATNVLYVPSTAITTTGTRHTVTVLANGVQTPTTVTIGVVGNSTTQIKSGLKAGQSVVLSTTTTSSTTTNTFPGGGPGGGGLGGGINP